MNIQLFQAFVEQHATRLGIRFTLQGTPVTYSEMADNTSLLPLVMLAVNESILAIHGHKPVDCLEAADETHLLGIRVKSLPEMPDALIGMHVHSALVTLALPPQHTLGLPLSRDVESLTEISELGPHIQKLQLSVDIKTGPSVQLENS